MFLRRVPTPQEAEGGFCDGLLKRPTGRVFRRRASCCLPPLRQEESLMAETCRVFEATAQALPGRWAVVVSRYNQEVTRKLQQGAVETLQQHGVSPQDIDVVWVPGAFEIPLVARRLASSGRYRAIICLGVVIQGQTTHDRQINRAVSLQLAQIAAETQVPVTLGVLSCYTRRQAEARAGGEKGNKGAECALVALEMAALLQQLPPSD